MERIIYSDFKAPEEFEILLQTVDKEKEKLLAGGVCENNKQVIGALLADGKGILTFENDINSSEDEENIIREVVSKGGRVERLVCVWLEGGVDLPSYSFRKRLIEIDPENKNAEIILAGIEEFRTRTIDSTMFCS